MSRHRVQKYQEYLLITIKEMKNSGALKLYEDQQMALATLTDAKC